MRELAVMFFGRFSNPGMVGKTRRRQLRSMASRKLPTDGNLRAKTPYRRFAAQDRAEIAIIKRCPRYPHTTS
jgi:hypothetical protein